MYTKIFFNPNPNPEILTLTIKIGNILRKKKWSARTNRLIAGTNSSSLETLVNKTFYRENHVNFKIVTSWYVNFI